MFPFGHEGITIAVVYALTVAVFDGALRLRALGEKRSLMHLEQIDFRIVMILAMLPDLIDKIVGMVLFKNEFDNGRLYMHSLLLIGIISACALGAARVKSYPKANTAAFILPLWLHLLLDKMWEGPGTLFWPLRGSGFPRIGVEIGDYITMLLTVPYIYVSEIVGTLILCAFVAKYNLYKKERLIRFLKDGRLLA